MTTILKEKDLLYQAKNVKIQFIEIDDFQVKHKKDIEKSHKVFFIKGNLVKCLKDTTSLFKNTYFHVSELAKYS